MAIWPWSRKNKRHTIQLGDPETATTASQPLPEMASSSFAPNVEPRLTRKKSKRQKNRHSDSASLNNNNNNHTNSVNVIATRSASFPHPPPTAHSQNTHPSQPSQHSQPSHHSQPLPQSANAKKSRAQKHPRFHESYTARSGPQQSTMSRSTSIKGKRGDNGHAVLKKRLSQRKLNKIAREQEIRLMASCPIDIPRRPGEPVPVAPVKRAPRSRSRRSERHRSETSLSVRDSAASSMSDIPEAYTFKVNALAAFTPRPLVRYEAPRLPTSRSNNASAASTRRERLPALTVSEENLSRRRVDHYVDDLDAGGLRELLERDRRRQERQAIEKQEKLQRKLERAAEKQRAAEARAAETADPSGTAEDERQNFLDGPSRPPTADAPREPDSRSDAVQSPEPAGSWLRDSSKEPTRSRETLESVHVIGNIDDSSIREPPKLVQRPSFAQSQDISMSRTTLSPAQSQSTSRHGLGSPTSSQIYGLGGESLSDASRTMDSERRLSDHSGMRMNTFSSLFRRGSSRLKRRYRERFHDQTSDFSSHASHASRESFSRIPTQSSAPGPAPAAPSPIPARPLPRSTNTVKRSQSKFTEHFGDEPLSPPDSRLQSPEIAEEPEEHPGSMPIPIGTAIGTAYPIPGSDSDLPAARNRHRSWISDNMDDDNVPLSQSLASIDSEGSWMSGNFLRRISQRRSNHPVRHSTGQFEGPDDASHVDDLPGFVRFSSGNDEERTSADAIEEPEIQPDLRLPDEDPAETWHTEVAKRPVLVNPTVRPKSTEGMLKNIQSLSPISAEAEFSPIEEHSAELDYATDEDDHDHGHGPVA